MSDLRLVPSDPLARLVERASKQTTTTTDDAALLRDALVVGRARIRHAQRRRWMMATSALCLSLLALAVSLPFAMRPAPEHAPLVSSPVAPQVTPPIASEPEERTSTMALGAHRVETTSGTRLSLQEGSLADVSLRLDAGAALFDVAPLGQGSFEVHAPDLTAIVHGTVFAMRVQEGRTRVDVFEGRVEVRGDFGAQMLTRGESYAPTSSALSPLLAQLGEEAARMREERAIPSSTSSTMPSHRRTTVTLAQLEAWRDAGEFDVVLEALREATPPRDEVGAWAMVEGDAARALGRDREAALAYIRASESLSPSRAAVAGLLAARRLERLHEDERALAVLASSHAADRGAPLEEQALATRALLRSRLGHIDEARADARDYLVSFPSGPGAAQMEALLQP